MKKGDSSDSPLPPTPTLPLATAQKKMPSPLIRGNSPASVVPTKTDTKTATVVNVKKEAPSVAELGVATASPKKATSKRPPSSTTVINVQGAADLSAKKPLQFLMKF